MNRDLIVAEIEKGTGKKIRTLTFLTDKVIRIAFTDESILILKETSKRIENIYNFLQSQGVNNIQYPKDCYKIDGVIYYTFEYITETFYPNNKKVLDLKQEINHLHSKTKVVKRLSTVNFKYFKRIYERLDAKFKLLETFVRTAETKPVKDDFEWIILSKYKIYLETKKMLYQLQVKLHGFIDAKESVVYALNHGKPNISHIMNKTIVSLEHARLSVVVSDIAKFYCENENYNLDWFKIIDDWLNQYEGSFYKVYFKFLVLYIFMINLNINSNYNYSTLNIYIRIAEKLRVAQHLFESYK